jgi:hypothetical protein
MRARPGEGGTVIARLVRGRGATVPIGATTDARRYAASASALVPRERQRRRLFTEKLVRSSWLKLFFGGDTRGPPPPPSSSSTIEAAVPQLKERGLTEERSGTNTPSSSRCFALNGARAG